MVPLVSSISIHAPTRGATIPVFRLIIKPVISIHAPTRGATNTNCFDIFHCKFQSTLPREERLSCFILTYGLIYFNPRSHERSDKSCSFTSLHLILISIHAPTRGATYAPNTPLFASRFQSTLPREERHNGCGIRHSLYPYFNPRSHERSDLSTVVQTADDIIFQSTLPREERQYATIYGYNIYIFQSTLPREERPNDLYLTHAPFISIHAPTRGATCHLVRQTSI